MNKKILESIYAFLQPIARLLLANGIGYQQFSEVAKSAFIYAASNDYGIRGRKTNISRIAAMTGISRKNAKEVLENLEAGNQLKVERYKSPSLAVQEWLTNSKYLDRRGKARLLTTVGSPSFDDLVKDSGCGLSPSAVRSELSRAGCIEIRENGSIKLINKDFFGSVSSENVARALSNQLRLHAETIFNNVCRNAEQPSRFERVIFTHKLDKRDVGSFRRLSSAKLEAWSSEMAGSIDTYDSLRGSEDKPRSEQKAAGIGLFYFEEGDDD